VTPIPTTKAKCIEELTIYLEEEGPLDNFVEDQTHEVDTKPAEFSKRANRSRYAFDYPHV